MLGDLLELRIVVCLMCLGTRSGCSAMGTLVFVEPINLISLILHPINLGDWLKLMWCAAAGEIVPADTSFLYSKWE